MREVIKNVCFFDNGNTAVFNESGEQIAPIQKSWFSLFVDFLIERGYDLSELEKMGFTFPNGTNGKYIAKNNTWKLL